MQTNLKYLNSPQFTELLNSCGSLTTQLENLKQYLTVSLLAEGVTHGHFFRLSLLLLNQVPVVAAYSQTLVQHNFFRQLLQDADITPIGKFLFATDSKARRLDNMQTTLLSITQVNELTLRDYLEKHYQHTQQFWQRQSVFAYQNEQMHLTEIILPSMEQFL